MALLSLDRARARFRVAVGGLVAALALLALPGCTCEPAPPADWVARLKGVQGTVRLISGDPPEYRGASEGDYLALGTRLETGPDGRAVLALRGGGTLTVKPNSLVRLQAGARPDAVRLSLSRGAVQGSTPAQMAADELLIVVGERTVRLGRKARATVSLPAKEGARPRLQVEYGQATLLQPGGEAQTVVAGAPLSFSLGPPDAGPPDQGPAVVVAPELTLYLTAGRRGRVQVQGPDEERPRTLRAGRALKLAEGARVVLSKGATARLGPEPGEGSLLRGPAVLRAERLPAGAGGAPGALTLRPESGTLRLSGAGQPGQTRSGLQVEGVFVVPRVTHKEVQLSIWREGDRALLSVEAGEARLRGSEGTAIVEAGQRATLQDGRIEGPKSRAAAAVTVQQPGTVRLFLPGRRTALSLRWPRPAGDRGALVEASRRRDFAAPLFADVIRRRQLTLADLPRGTVYWRVRPITAEGSPGEPTSGAVRILPDTSHRRLQGRVAPKNTIRHGFGNTTVYYQNLLPGFTFTWPALPGASRYRLRLLREQNLGEPLISRQTAAPRAKVPPGKLGEGRYLWYVLGYDKRAKQVGALEERQLSIRYDNATPNVQITTPANGATVQTPTVEVRGIALRGSRVRIAGQPADLDEAYRFSRTVPLHPGKNTLLIRVTHPRSGTSLYLRQVTRK